LGNIVSPTPIVNVIFAARELERGTLSPGQTATLVQHYVTYVEFKPLCPRTTVTVNASGVITTEGPDRWACAETPPIAAFVFSPTNPAPGSPVVFNAAGSQASSGRTIVQYVWDFGDPNSPARGTGPTATHTYGVEGTYNATLTVVDDAGQQGSKSQTVPVKAAAP
jgi:PKD repeat protein